jgi:hypothetical protein
MMYIYGQSGGQGEQRTVLGQSLRVAAEVAALA